MSKYTIFKQVYGTVVAMGASGVVSNMIKATTPTELKPLKKGVLIVGGFFLSGMVGDQTAKYAEAQLDEMVESFQKARSMMDQKQADTVQGEVVEEKDEEESK